jgi:hypothetical protein
MGTIADRIARNIAAQARAPVVDLAAHRSARHLFKEAEIDRDGFERRIGNGLDPCFAVYAHAQAIVSIAAEHLSTTKEARQFARIVWAFRRRRPLGPPRDVHSARTMASG